MTATEEFLKSIDASLKELVAIAKRRQSANGAPAGGAVADDADLDSQYGDPTVRANPRDWNDGDFKGHRYSQCPPAFLDMLADMLDYFASRKEATEPKKAGYDRRDAARARGWGRRLRAGWKPSGKAQAPASGGSYDFDDGTGHDAAEDF